MIQWRGENPRLPAVAWEVPCHLSARIGPHLRAGRKVNCDQEYSLHWRFSPQPLTRTAQSPVARETPLVLELLPRHDPDDYRERCEVVKVEVVRDGIHHGLNEKGQKRDLYPASERSESLGAGHRLQSS